MKVRFLTEARGAPAGHTVVTYLPDQIEDLDEAFAQAFVDAGKAEVVGLVEQVADAVTEALAPKAKAKKGG